MKSNIGPTKFLAKHKKKISAKRNPNSHLVLLR